MNSQLAFLICAVGVAGLFFLDRDKSVRTSPALWLPILYLSIIASRPVSMWLGAGGGSVPPGDVLAATLDGSPQDAAVSGALIAAGTIVLARRRRTRVLLKACAPILFYYAYCLMSTAWSPFPETCSKRWIKFVGDLVMVLVILTDPQPIAALRRVYSRVAFVMFPLSVLFIKFTNLGVSYDEQGPHYTGVTTNKNAFGLMLYVFAIGVVWNIRALLVDRKAPNRKRRLVAQGILLGFGTVLLHMAHSATSVFCFILGSCLMMASELPIMKRRPRMLHALCFGILVMGVGSLLLGGTGTVAGAMGRTSDLSGRTEIWAASIASADNPWIGTGFESFWNKNNPKVVRILLAQGYGDISILNSAHNGYLQIYLDLGWVGVSLLAFILVSGYLKAVKACRLNRDLGGLLLAYMITCAFYSITESGFRIMTLSWIFLLLAVVGATGVISGVVKGKERDNRLPRRVGASNIRTLNLLGVAARVFRMVTPRMITARS